MKSTKVSVICRFWSALLVVESILIFIVLCWKFRDNDDVIVGTAILFAVISPLCNAVLLRVQVEYLERLAWITEKMGYGEEQNKHVVQHFQKDV